MTIRLSDAALADLEDIRLYTLEAWGREQWNRYYLGLVEAFEQISIDPKRGRDRSLFLGGMRSIRCGQHLIFYKCFEVAGGAAVILRIVHARRNLPALTYYDALEG